MMYAGAPYAGAPYAGEDQTGAEPIVGAFAGAVLSVVAWLEVAEVDAAVTLPAAGVHRYDVVRVLPTPTLVNGRPT